MLGGYGCAGTGVLSDNLPPCPDCNYGSPNPINVTFTPTGSGGTLVIQ